MKGRNTIKIVILALCFALTASSCAGSKSAATSSNTVSSNAVSSSISTAKTKKPSDCDPRKVKEIEGADSGVNGTLYYINMSSVLNSTLGDSVMQYDTLRFITCLQGLLNRDKPVIYVDYIDSDSFWYAYLRKEGKLLYGYKKQSIDTFSDFTDIFKDEIVKRGLVLWDDKVNSTANVATTICGVDGYLPVRANSKLLEYLTAKLGVKTKMSLVGKFTGTGIIPDTNVRSSGSKKCDAYIWAMEKYLKECSDTLLGNMPDGGFWPESSVPYPDLPNSGMANLDYYTCNKVFLFDLSPWGDEARSDDPTQPIGTDLMTFKNLLQRQYDRTKGQKMISVSGFVPWHLKYTTFKNKGKHEEVPSEWVYAEILTAYNCFMDADCIGYYAIPNVSVYQQYKLEKPLKNNRPTQKLTFDPKKKYVMFYMGDYDGCAWTSRFVAKYWVDDHRGDNPLGWAFNPNLSSRIPMVFDFIYENKTPNDYFIAGDSGAGYVMPTYLNEPRKYSDNPSGMQVWIDHNKKFFSLMDLSITGFLINGSSPITNEVLDAYIQFSPDGIGSNNYGGDGTVYKGVPCKVNDLDLTQENYISVADATKKLLNQIRGSYNNVNFFSYRTILTSPTYMTVLIKNIKEQNDKIVVVDPYTFYDLIKQRDALKGSSSSDNSK